MAINIGAFTGKDLDDGRAQLAQLVLSDAPTITGFLDRSQEATAQSSDNVIVDNYHFDVDGASASTMAVAVRGYKDNFQAPKEFSLSQQTWKIDQGGENSFKLYEQDLKRTSRGRQLINDGTAKLRNNSVVWREANVLAYLDSLESYTTAQPTADDLPKLDNTGANGNAGKIFETTIGAAANTIDPVTGALNGNNSAKNDTARAIIDAIATLRTRIRRRHVGVNEQGMVIGGDPGIPAILNPPEVGRAVVESLRQLDLQGEQLNRELYRDMGVFGAQAFDWQLNNLAGFSTTGIKLPSSATAGFTCYLMTNKAIQYAEDEVLFWTQVPNYAGGTNEGSFLSFHQIFRLGRKLINPECIIRVNFRTA